jgi:hypothetical protein
MTTLRSFLFDQILYGSYTMDHFESKEQEKFIELGFARYKTGDKTVIDEPLAILAAMHWLNNNAEFSLFEFLRHGIDKHSPRKNGFEAYLVFYFRKVFEVAPKLDEVFTFRDDFARMREQIPWQSEEFELVTVTGTEVSAVMPSCGPSSNVGLMASNNDVSEWISTNKRQFTFCFPPNAFGPDILFFLRHKESGRLLLLMIQAKYYTTVDATYLLKGVRTVTPSWWWKSKSTNACFTLTSVSMT